MRCGASSAEHQKLKDAQAELASHRKKVEEKDRQIQKDTNDLLTKVSESNLRAELITELEAAAAAHQEEMEAQQRQLQEHHSSELRRHLEKAEESHRQALEAPPAETMREGEGAGPPQDYGHEEVLAEAQASHEERISAEELRAQLLQEELENAQTEVQRLRQERDSEAEAASVTHEAYVAEHRASVRKGEALSAEVQIKFSEMEALEDSQRGIHNQAKLLQAELSRLAYGVGQKDQQLKAKESELSEVRQSLSGIQDEMDEVGHQLKVQCGRVQRVEQELSVSRDLGDKVRTMRQMVQESHSAMTQLCGLLEQERQQKDQCSQGLKQQRLRTELLLQLLHHFKNRTQDLAPQALLASGAGELRGGNMPNGSAEFPGSSLQEPVSWYPEGGG
eukprot:TRINITY_DN40200_c0_g1_i1.p1 TRINITY_DN40200_c0_g1~~TRINITY_DN40200_c0_g1_i1.p1  ORF type:complete len:392 (-),score=103.26 TRINITY_DN40200_c0_g1_i1:44-1219(-)